VTPHRAARGSGSPRVGLFGLLGAGNSGNDGSMETVLEYFRTAHPEAVLDAMCGGPEVVRAKYDIPAVPMFWYQQFEQRKPSVPPVLLKLLGKGVDTVRTVSWAARHDAVIVPGAGAFETTLPQRAWGFPYALFLLTLSGKVFGTRVALVSVGADVIGKRITRWLSNSTARLASYRSYRDAFSRDVMRQRGIDTSGDRVYPDLVFGIPTPPYTPGDPRLVGVGVMAYQGGNDDRKQAEQIRTSYLEGLTRFTGWLIDRGNRVRLVGGDSKFDGDVARQVIADVRRDRPGLDQERISAVPASSYAGLMRALEPCGIVVATRYHNVMCALKLCKPTISLGYSQKFVSLMGGMGLAEFNQPAAALDVDRLKEQFQEVERRHTELRQQMAEQNAANRQSLADQFAVLSATLLLAGPNAAAAGHDQVAPAAAGRPQAE
jgi:polysaccharide pyruvyl transferase WcaK-like protein